LVEFGPDRDERHVQAFSSSLKRALETETDEEGVDGAVRAAMGDEVAQDELEQSPQAEPPPSTASEDHPPER
jgi:hypothetical protein